MSPRPLIEQLAVHGRVIAPVIEDTRQRLTLLGKTVDGAWRESLADVLYVSLQGRYGVGSDPLQLSWDKQAALGGDDRIQARAVAVEHRRRLALFVSRDESQPLLSFGKLPCNTSVGRG